MYERIREWAERSYGDWVRAFGLAALAITIVLLTLAPIFFKVPLSTVNTLSTMILALLTFWYAYTTRGLFKITREQTRAVKAGNTPHIDLIFEEQNGDIFAEVANRGDGPATDVKLIFTVDTLGERHQYIGEFARTLQPGRTYSTDSAEICSESLPLKFQPQFYIEEYTEDRKGRKTKELVDFVEYLNSKELDHGNVISTDVEYTDLSGETHQENGFVRAIPRTSSSKNGENLTLGVLMNGQQVPRDPTPRRFPHEKIKIALTGHKPGDIELTERAKIYRENLVTSVDSVE